MNRLPVLLSAAVLAGCATPSYEVVRVGDGMLRATTHSEAAAYCSKDRLNLRVLGKAPAETGVLFRCE